MKKVAFRTKKIKFIATTFTLIFLFLVILQSCKKEKIYTGSIKGIVVSEYGLPLSGVVIALNDLDQTFAFSDSDGKFLLENVPVGNYSILASRDKFLSEGKTTTVKKDEPTILDFSLKVGETTLEIDKENLDIPYTIEVSSLAIQSNSTWMSSTSADWLTVDKSTGIGDSNITVSAKENETDELRTANLTVTSGGITKVIAVNQSPKIRLLSVSLTYPITETVILTFNTPVDGYQMTFTRPNSILHLPFISQPPSKEVHFKIGSAKLGESFPFRITTKDKFLSYTEDFNIDFFSKRITYPAEGSGIAPSYFISDDNKSIWFSNFNSQIIQKIDLKNFTVVNNYKFNFKIREIIYNPYNKFIYALTNTPDIYIINPDNGSIVKRFTLKILPEDSKVYPTIYPQTLVFTSSGIGAMICGSEQSSATSWKMIDSRNNDLVYYHKQSEKFYAYGSISVNYNRTKLYIKAEFSTSLFSLDPVNDLIEDISPPLDKDFNYIVPNKKNENVYFGHYGQPYIYNPVTKYTSAIAFNSSPGIGDFSYRPGEEEVIYAFSGNILNVFNHKTTKKLYSFPSILMSSSYPVSSTDGKYLIVFDNFTLFRFDTELFTGK